MVFLGNICINTLHKGSKDDMMMMMMMMMIIIIIIIIICLELNTF
jgi:hypothetical protein